MEEFKKNQKTETKRLPISLHDLKVAVDNLVARVEAAEAPLSGDFDSSSHAYYLTDVKGIGEDRIHFVLRRHIQDKELDYITEAVLTLPPFTEEAEGDA